MSANSTTAAARPAAIPDARPAGSREVRQTASLVAGAVALGGVLQVFIEPGPRALVVGAAAAGAFVFVLSQVAPGRWRETLSSFRFTATLLIALSLCAVLGTLVLQNRPMAFYEREYGPAGSLVVAMRLDDIFHSLWFAGLIALFFAAVLNSALLRWPVRVRTAGFFTCHLGLLTSLVGAGASAAWAVRGRVDLHAGGETARHVAVTRNGVPTGEMVPLGFDLRLDRFDLVRYTPEFRIGYYDLTGPEARLKASFDPEPGVKHLLPGGDSFRIQKLYPDARSRVVAVPGPNGPPAQHVVLAGEERWLFPGDRFDGPGGVAVVFGEGLPAAPPAQTAILVSATERRVVVRRSDGERTFDLREGLDLAEGLVRFGPAIPSAQRRGELASASDQMRNPAAVLEVTVDGEPRETGVMLAARQDHVRTRSGALVFERREDEVKAYVSQVTTSRDGARQQARIAVNDPLSVGGWTFYQVNYDPKDPSYSGLEAVRDPGVPWVFLGFGLITAGVAYMFYVETRLKRAKAQA
ncbi:MAG TPA: cytochrome c biogenesis protein ResB [Anaeromyxobacteraceae bacterium]